MGVELIASMMMWVATFTGLPLPVAPPHLVFLQSQEALERRADAKVLAGQGITVGAVYDALTFTIYVPPGFSLDDPDHRALLAHEVTHYLQHRAGRLRTCRNDMEHEAEQVQRAWLKKEGGDPSRVLSPSLHYPCREPVTRLPRG